MTDSTPPQDQPPLVVNGQYIKDFSFEVPNAPDIFAELGQSAPEIPISIDIRANHLQNNSFEVVLHIQIDSKLGGKPAFIVDLAYAGVFTLHVPQEHLQPMLLVECPRLLFPYARNIVADATRDGGFPPLMLQPIDFVQLYRQRMERMAAEQGGQVGNA